MSCHLRSIEDNSSDEYNEKYETISYAVVYDDLSGTIKREKLPLDVNGAIQFEITKQEQLPENAKINVHSEVVGILSKGSPGMMKEAQEEDVDIRKIIHYVKYGKKTALSHI